MHAKLHVYCTYAFSTDVYTAKMQFADVYLLTSVSCKRGKYVISIMVICRVPQGVSRMWLSETCQAVLVYPSPTQFHVTIALAMQGLNSLKILLQ